MRTPSSSAPLGTNSEYDVPFASVACSVPPSLPTYWDTARAPSSCGLTFGGAAAASAPAVAQADARIGTTSVRRANGSLPTQRTVPAARGGRNALRIARELFVTAAAYG